LYVLAQLGATAVHETKYSFASCAALAAIFYTPVTANICSYVESLRLCSFAEAGIALKFWVKIV